MPRVTYHGPSRPITRTGVIGYDPDLPTGDVPDPIDYADDARWFIPAFSESSGAAEDANLGATLTDGGGTLTFSSPTNANDGNDTTDAEVGAYAGNGVTDYVGYLRSDLGAEFLISSFYVFGVTGCNAGDPYWTFEWSADGSTGWTAIPTNDTDVNLGGGMGQTKDAQLVTPTSARYVRLVYDDGVHGGFRCGTEIYTWEVNGAPYEPEVVWLPAFAVHDDDNATFDQSSEEAVDVAADVFLRCVLTTDVILSSVVLRLGLEDAGSATITLEGATDEAFTTPVELDVVTQTATGSYTSDTWTFSPIAEGYVHLRFVLTTAQGARPYEVTLTGLPDPATTIADHLTDTTDAHDASAVSLLDTAGNTTATNVEDAIAELYGLTDIWRPVMAHDGTNWYVVVDGDGTAVMAQG